MIRVDFIKDWITNICSALILITAVDLILPDNSIKKYCKLILGLILMIVVINPVLSLFNSDLAIDAALENNLFYENEPAINSGDDVRTSITEAQFKKSLEDEIIAILKEELPEYTFNVNASIEFKGVEEVVLKQVEVGYHDASVKTIEKINIENNIKENTAVSSDGMEDTIVNILYQEGSISKDLIKIYKY